MRSSLGRQLIAGYALMACILSGTAMESQAGDRFLTYPFANDNQMWIQQSWTYTDGTAHKGMDFIRGTPDKSATWQSFNIKAAAPGIVDTVNTNPAASSWGNYVIIKHRKGDFNPPLSTDYFSVYAHLATVSAPAVGKVITRGTTIGTAGKTGQANNVLHLHWEVHQTTKMNKIDPLGIYLTRDKYPRWPGYRSTNQLRSTEDANTRFTTVPPSGS